MGADASASSAARSMKAAADRPSTISGCSLFGDVAILGQFALFVSVASESAGGLRNGLRLKGVL